MSVLAVTPGTLPSGFCPTSYQDMLNNFSANQTVTVPDSDANIVVSASTPTDTTAVWQRLDSFGRPLGVYFFASGAWLSPHPLQPGMTVLWTTTLPTLTTFDGGDANPVSAISGPMWEVVTALQAKSPIGVGTLPSSTVLAVGDTGGVETVTLGLSNIPSHNHELWAGNSDGTASGIREALQTINNPHAGTSAAYAESDGVSGHNNWVKDIGGDGSGNAVAHTNMSPYVAVYFLRRTGRLYYRV